MDHFETDETQPWRRPRVLASLGVVALVVLALAAWGLLRGGDGPSTASTQQSSPSVTPPSTSASPIGADGVTYDSSCGLHGGMTTLPATTAPATTWDSIEGGWVLPRSSQYGPGRLGDVRTCFARVPMGAVIAAYTEASQVDGLSADFDRAVTLTTMPGVGQSALRSIGRKSLPAVPTVPRGFVIDSYTKDEATVSYYLATGPTETTCSFMVVWSQGDWRLKLNPDGTTPQGCISGSPSRFIPWGA